MSSLRSLRAGRASCSTIAWSSAARPAARFFSAESERIARLCHRMAERFARGGRLIALGISPAARSDVRHVAVEFVHPVIVGKRALPALGLTGESGRLARELELSAEPDDIVIAFGEPSAERQLETGVSTARARGCLTIAFAPLGAEWEFEPPSDDDFVRQELVETTYHVLWELVHVFFEHRGLLEGRTERRQHDAGASSFLYPFLAEREHDLDAVLADVRLSVLMKAEEVQALRESRRSRARPRCSPTRRAATAPALRRRRAPAGARQRRLGDRCHRRGRRLRLAAGPIRLAVAARDRPRRRHGDHHRDRQ